MEEKITIIEGPSPTFELIYEGWPIGIIDSPHLANLAVTRLRTYNGGELVERCHRAWRNRELIHLEYKSEDGGKREVPIIAARTLENEEGQLLILWVRLPNDEVSLEIDYDFDDDEGEEDDFHDLSL